MSEFSIVNFSGSLLTAGECLLFLLLCLILACAVSFMSISSFRIFTSRDSSRSFAKDVKRVVIKVGAAAISRSDGLMAIGRLGSLCEQIKELTNQGYQVILVSSGAVTIGRQKFRHKKSANESFADLPKSQLESERKASSYMGLSDLFRLYDVLFNQLDMASAKLTVTDRKLEDTSFKMQLSETVNSLLDQKVVPIFNENEAYGTRQDSYEDSSCIFWDNDTRPGLLAKELKADLLIVLSDVDGLYSGPPSEPGSKIIHTYIKEIHEAKIKFGDMSRVGRRGMIDKVKAASDAAFLGIPAVISSGFAFDGISKVLKGERIGTLFPPNAAKLVTMKESSAHEMVMSAQECAIRLRWLSSEERKRILLDVADALEANKLFIKAENEADITAAKLAGYEKSVVSRLTLDSSKLSSLSKSIRELAADDDPIQKVINRTKINDAFTVEIISCPVGMLLLIFESFPDVVVQIASLALRTGNGLVFKGGREVARSSAILHKVITEAIPKEVGKDLIGLITPTHKISDFLKLRDVIDLVIPQGSNKLISKIKGSTNIPVLAHADGVHHVFVDKSANMEMAKAIVSNSKIDCPAIFNVKETFLVHEDLVESGKLNDLVTTLKLEGVNIFGGPRARTALDILEAKTSHHEHNSLDCTLEIVDDVFAAANHIYSSRSDHTNWIIAEDQEVVELFLSIVESAKVFHSESTCFCDGTRFGLNVEDGRRTKIIHAKGHVCVGELLATQRVLIGHGQAVVGDQEVVDTHKEPLYWLVALPSHHIYLHIYLTTILSFY